MKTKTCQSSHEFGARTGAPVASVAMQNDRLFASANIASTMRPVYEQAALNQLQSVDRGTGNPCRALIRSWRLSGRESSYLPMIPAAIALGSAITCGQTLSGKGA